MVSVPAPLRCPRRMRLFSGAYTGHFRSGAVWGRVRWPVEVSARLERRPRGQTPTGDDAATCLESGNELVSHAIGGVTLPGSRAPVLGFLPPLRRRRRHRVQWIGLTWTDARGARGARPRRAVMPRPVGRAVTSHGATPSPGSLSPGHERPSSGFTPRLGVSGGIGCMGSGRVGWTREAPEGPDPDRR